MDHDRKTVVLDTTDWAEILTHEAVCEEKMYLVSKRLLMVKATLQPEKSLERF